MIEKMWWIGLVSHLQISIGKIAWYSQKVIRDGRPTISIAIGMTNEYQKVN